jgi:hypothetical protein
MLSSNDLTLPLVSDDANVCSVDMLIPCNSTQTMGAFDGNSEWPQRANSSIHGPAALASNVTESPFPWFSPVQNKRSASRPTGEMRIIRTLSFTFSELEGMGSCWALNQQQDPAKMNDGGNDFVDMPAWCSGHRRKVSELSDDILACTLHSRNVSALSLDYEMNESDNSLTF